jgi:hypothetical protein
LGGAPGLRGGRAGAVGRARRAATADELLEDLEGCGTAQRACAQTARVVLLVDLLMRPGGLFLVDGLFLFILL